MSNQLILKRMKNLKMKKYKLQRQILIINIVIKEVVDNNNFHIILVITIGLIDSGKVSSLISSSKIIDLTNIVKNNKFL